MRNVGILRIEGCERVVVQSRGQLHRFSNGTPALPLTRFFPVPTTTPLPNYISSIASMNCLSMLVCQPLVSLVILFERGPQSQHECLFETTER